MSPVSPIPHRFGRRPYRSVVVHGGPGAPGSLAPVARVLGRSVGVLEPWQTARSVDGQVEELARVVRRWATPPVTVIGHSWGAWLSILLTVRHPTLVGRLVLVGAAPFRARDADAVRDRRRKRLSPNERSEYETLGRRLSDPHARVSASAMRRLGTLTERVDSFAPVSHRRVGPPPDPALFRKVWREAEELRRRGDLLRALRHLRVPVLVLHGRYDPHPVRGVVKPLRDAGADLRVVVLERCGHEPWWERYARNRFFDRLRREVVQPP